MNSAVAALKRSNFGKAGRQGAKALFAFTARSLQQASTLLVTLLAARILPPAQYGIYSLGIVFIVLVQTMTYTGFYQFILTTKDDDKAVLSTCFWMIVGLVSLASLGLALAAFPLEWIFQAKPLGTVLLLLALIQPLASIGAWSSAAMLRRGEIMRNFTVMFAQNLVALVGGVLLLWFWHSIYALVAFRYLRVMTGAVLYAALGRDRPQLLFRKDLARKATAFSGGLYGSRMPRTCCSACSIPPQRWGCTASAAASRRAPPMSSTSRCSALPPPSSARPHDRTRTLRSRSPALREQSHC